mmetsp:Transcript_6647/g.11327  ORF Transcript_6647/g.11327 Transcript_6647/m.11327 type:complete len:219 (-) Transcript_6647:21-677(-)
MSANDELPLPAAAEEEEGIFDVTSETIDAKLLFLGLDNAGKTTLLQMLKNDKMTAQLPTLHPQSEQIVIGKVRYTCFDLAGHETGRRIWKDYIVSADCLLFLVDSADRTRFPEAAEEIKMLLAEPMVQALPLAVIAQKTDLPEAASEAEFAEAMGVNGLGDRPVKVFCTSCVKRTGLADSLNWIQEQLFERRARIPVQTPPETCTTSAAADMEDDFMV